MTSFLLSSFFFFFFPKCLFAEFVARLGFVGFFSLFFLMSRNEIFSFYLNLICFFFYLYLSASQPQIRHAGQGWAERERKKRKRCLQHPNICTFWQRTIWGWQCFSETNASPRPVCCAVVGFFFRFFFPNGAGSCGSVQWTRPHPPI